MTSLKVLLLILIVDISVCEFEIYKELCLQIDNRVDNCMKTFEQPYINNREDVSKITRKINGRSFMDPATYSAIIPEVCSRLDNYEVLLRCSYTALESCLSVEYRYMLPTQERFIQGFRYFCRRYQMKELTIQCHENNTRQVKPPEQRILDFETNMTQCIRKNTVFQPAVQVQSQSSSQTNTAQRNIDTQCANYNVGYRCVENIFYYRCHRTRNIYLEFYHYLRPYACSASQLAIPLWLISLLYLTTKIILSNVST